MLSNEIARVKADEYARIEEIEITGELGFGIDGTVFRTTRGTALKSFDRKDKLTTERDSYLRFLIERSPCSCCVSWQTSRCLVLRIRKYNELPGNASMLPSAC